MIYFSFSFPPAGHSTHTQPAIVGGLPAGNLRGAAEENLQRQSQTMTREFIQLQSDLGNANAGPVAVNRLEMGFANKMKWTTDNPLTIFDNLNGEINLSTDS